MISKLLCSLGIHHDSKFYHVEFTRTHSIRTSRCLRCDKVIKKVKPIENKG